MTSKTSKTSMNTELRSRHETTDKSEYFQHRGHIVWVNVITFAILHSAALYGLYLAITSARLYTSIYAYLTHLTAGMGITAGAHRLWSHRAYKATKPFQVLLMLLNSLACQNSVIVWARDHRVHHKYTETDADPHNAKRGFFFAHIGWLLSKKHPDVMRKGKGVYMSDLEQDPILIFQQNYYIFLVLGTWIIATMIPVYLWNETWKNAFFVITILRYVYTLNTTWLVNSAAHLFGDKPYDKSINPAENKLVSLVAGGEGWHNYHHVFPMDYKTSELGSFTFNGTKSFIDFFAFFGWAYDLKSITPKDIKDRVTRTGDGTHNVWGWNGQDQYDEKRDPAVLTNARNQKEKEMTMSWG